MPVIVKAVVIVIRIAGYVLILVIILLLITVIVAVVLAAPKPNTSFRGVRLRQPLDISVEDAVPVHVVQAFQNLLSAARETGEFANRSVAECTRTSGSVVCS